MIANQEQQFQNSQKNRSRSRSKSQEGRNFQNNNNNFISNQNFPNIPNNNNSNGNKKFDIPPSNNNNSQQLQQPNNFSQNNNNGQQNYNNNSNKCVLHIGNLSQEITDEQFKAAIESNGVKMDSFKIMKNSSDGKPLQHCFYAFVTFNTRQEGEKIVQAYQSHQWQVSFKKQNDNSNNNNNNNNNNSMGNNSNNYNNQRNPRQNNNYNNNNERGGGFSNRNNNNNNQDYNNNNRDRDNRRDHYKPRDSYGNNNRDSRRDSTREHRDRDRDSHRGRDKDRDRSRDRHHSSRRKHSDEGSNYRKKSDENNHKTDSLNMAEMLLLPEEQLTSILDKQQPQSSSVVGDQIMVRELFVGNIPVNVTEKILEKTMAVYGKIQDIELKNHNGKCFAFVKFYKVEHATNAFFNSKTIGLLLSGQIKMYFADHLRRYEIVGDHEKELDEKDLSKVIYIAYHHSSKKVPSEDKLKSICKEYGDVRAISFNQFENTPIKTYILVEFYSISQAKRAFKSFLHKKYKLLDETVEVCILVNSENVLKGKDIKQIYNQNHNNEIPIINNINNNINQNAIPPQHQQQPYPQTNNFKPPFQPPQNPQQQQQHFPQQQQQNPQFQQSQQQQQNNNNPNFNNNNNANFNNNPNNPNFNNNINNNGFGRGRGRGRGRGNFDNNNNFPPGNNNNNFNQQQQQGGRGQYYNNNNQFNNNNNNNNNRFNNNNQQQQNGNFNNPNFQQQQQRFGNNNNNFQGGGRGRGQFNNNNFNPQNQPGGSIPPPILPQQNQFQQQQQQPVQPPPHLIGQPNQPGQIPAQQMPTFQDFLSDQKKNKDSADGTKKSPDFIETINQIIGSKDNEEQEQQKQNEQGNANNTNNNNYNELDDIDAFWSGFITRNKNAKVGVDIKFIQQSNQQEVQISSYHLNVSHRANFEDIFKKQTAAFAVMVPSNELDIKAFKEFAIYFTQKQKAGVVQTDNYFIYLLPKCSQSEQVYENLASDSSQLLVVIQDINAPLTQDQEYDMFAESNNNNNNNNNEENYSNINNQNQQQNQQQQQQQQNIYQPNLGDQYNNNNDEDILNGNNNNGMDDKTEDITQIISENPDLLNNLLNSIEQE